MKPLSKFLVILFAVFSLTVAGVMLSYDALYNVLPPALAQRLPDLDAPAPTALPAPSQAVAQIDQEDVIIPGVEEPTATPIPPTAEPTLVPTDIATEASAEVATNTPTPEPPTATPEPTEVPPTPTPSPTPLPVSLILDGVYNVPQAFNNCGPANLSIALNYHGVVLDLVASNTHSTRLDELKATQTYAASFLKPNPNDRNVSPWQISEFVNEQTILQSTAHSGGDIDLLKRLIAAGFLPVIERGEDFNDGEGWYGHYLTVYGYDDNAQTLLAMDTFGEGGVWSANGATYSYANIEETWYHFNNTFYVVYPEQRHAEIQSILGPTLTIESSMWEAAIAQAKADIQADPTNKFAWFNLGTSLTWMGQLTGDSSYYEQGAEAFDQARQLDLPWRMLWYQFRPYMAYYKIGRLQDVVDLADATLGTRGGRNVEETYYWKGNALTLLGDVGGARTAYTEALNVNENFYFAQWALDYLNR